MPSQRADAVAPARTRLAPSPSAGEHPALRLLGVAAFVLLAAALCARAVLNEDRSVLPGQLLIAPELASSGTLMSRHLSHLLAAAGMALAATWMTLSRRSWRLGGLEAAALLLAGAALLSVPGASDKRLALNAAIDAILPLIAAACLYQLLRHRCNWRRALLVVMVALAAANCAKATAQMTWEARQRWARYQEDKPRVWSEQGISLNDPMVATWEALIKTARPMGFIQGPNVFGSFLLLGLAATGAGLAACGWWRAKGPSMPDNDGTTSAGRRRPTWRASWLAVLAMTALGLLAVWHLVVMTWIHVAGATAGLLALVLALVVVVRLRTRPARLAIVLAGGLFMLQSALVVLALAPSDLHRSLLGYHGAGNKVRTLGARACYYQGAIRLFAGSPLTGVGPSQFGKHYLAVAPAYSDETPADAHNWLLNVAAEWGVFGVLGVLVAVVVAGWTIVRALSRPPSAAGESAWAVLPLTILILLVCWSMLARDLPRSVWVEVLCFAMVVSLVVGVLTSFCRLSGNWGLVLLTAGFVGFLVHCMAEITPSVAGVMWPFWATVALAMAWNEPVPAGRQPARPRMAHSGPTLATAAVLAVVVLTVQPMRAVGKMHQAQRAALAGEPAQAINLFKAAAEADALDPLPLKAAAILRFQRSQADRSRLAEHYQDYWSLSRAAVQRNQHDPEFWRSAALSSMYLATVTDDYALVDFAVESMQRAVQLRPLWPEGWLELVRMAAATGARGGDRPAMLRTALGATAKALALQDLRAKEGLTVNQADRAELLRTREDLLRRLSAAGGGRGDAPVR